MKFEQNFKITVISLKPLYIFFDLITMNTSSRAEESKHVVCPVNLTVVRVNQTFFKFNSWGQKFPSQNFQFQMNADMIQMATVSLFEKWNLNIISKWLWYP